MTDQNHGSNVPSGSGEAVAANHPTKVTPKKKRRRRPRKRKDKKNGSTNWQEMAKELDEKLRTLQEENAQLKMELKDLESRGLSEREAVQLRRLRHLHGRVMNTQVCEECQPKVDSLVEDAKWIK